uniref:Uncharacterized protein n=1 Tax=Arundo donax TaxID=35708 RepID=A0A0A9G140_ARUDO
MFGLCLMFVDSSFGAMAAAEQKYLVEKCFQALALPLAHHILLVH